ncbi:hypothetical protein GGI16_006383, partial [Coemansia sp. S142-1]
MSAHSPLQLLPIHVVQLIVNHVAGSSRMVYDGVRINSHEHRTLLKPLLWVCHNFRTVTYSRYCNNFELNLSTFSFYDLDPLHSPDRCEDAVYRRLNYLGYSTHHFAKDITVFVDMRIVYSGKALEAISRSPYDGCSFPLARRIAFYFLNEAIDEADEDIDTDPLLVEANIGAFVERVKQMAPLVGEISIDPAENEDMPRIASQYLGHLASRLYQPACCIEYNYAFDATDTMRLQLDMICNLTQVSYMSNSRIGDAYQFVQLARKNALILQSLVLECEHDIDILGLVQDA